jgi:putative transcriptional regulator
MSAVIRHHPDSATLLSFAAATLAEPLAAVIAAHLSMCAACRAELADLELLGAALLLAEPHPPGTAPVAAPRRPTEARRASARNAQPGDRLPAPIAAAYGLTLGAVPWRRLGPGVWHHRLALRQASAGDLRLIRIAPGRTMPDHGHGGSELTMVIEGCYRDVTGEYRRGDIQDADEDLEHQIIVDTAGVCICLIASERPAHFKSWLGRLVQPWTGL